MATWIENDKARARFWAHCKVLGFDHDAVHAALGVTSLKDYKGTEAEAIATLTAAKAKIAVVAPPAPEAPPALDAPPPLVGNLKPETVAALEAAVIKATPADDELTAAYALACRELPEAPALAFTALQTAAGFVWHVTLRAGLSALMETEALASIARQVAAFERLAGANGWAAVADGRDTVAVGMKPRAEAAPPTNGKPVAASPAVQAGKPQQGQGNGSLTFNADRLVGNRSKGKNYWRVKGGKYQQHGVMIWDEVLTAAGFDPNTLDVDAEYGLPGYVATYILNEYGNPAKVTKLELAAN